MIVSKLDRQGRITIPRSVRDALNLSPGAELTYSIEAGGVRIAEGAPTGDAPFCVFNEWDSEADTAAYADL